MTIKERLIEYSQNIVDDKIIACQKHKWACERFLNDVKREGTKEFPYIWIEEEAQKIVDWFSLLKHSKGVLAGEPIRIDENLWQLFNNGNLYGWYHMETGYRRFRKGYIQVARKNAKSQNMAGIGLYENSYISTKNNEISEVYTAGTKKDQSRIIFEEAKLMLKGSPLQNRFNILRTEIVHRNTGSFMKPLSKEDGQKGDGTNPQCFLIDEYHQHPTSEFYDLADSGMMARGEPLLLIITTAGTDLNAPCYQEEYKYCSRILEGAIVNDSYYVMICELDKDDDISDEKNWIKANPIVMTYPEGIAQMRESYEIAKEVPEKMRTFITKNLNVWIQQREDGYMNMTKWRECGATKENPFPDVAGLPVISGVDLSAIIDLTSVGFEVALPDGRIAVLSHSFIPEDTLQEKMRSDKVPYDLWAKQGWLTITPGATVDYNYVLKYIVDTYKKYQWTKGEVCFDRNLATWLMKELENREFTPVEIPQTTPSLSEPTKDFRAQVYNKKVIHDNNPVLTWAIGNAVTREDHNGNIMLDKSKSTERIDPIASLINAHVRAISQFKIVEEDIFYSPDI